MTEKTPGAPIQPQGERPSGEARPPRRDKGRRLLTERDRVALS